MKSTTIPVCPQCGSDNVKSVYLASPSELAKNGSKQFEKQSGRYPIGVILLGWQPENPGVYICKDCNFYGICPHIEKDKLKDFRKFLTKKKTRKIY